MPPSAEPRTTDEPDTDDIVRVLARHVADFQTGDLPGDVVAATKRSLLDTIGVALAATGLSRPVPSIVDLVIAAGGAPDALILGSHHRVPAHMAAFANGAMAHCLDYDDHCYEAGLHPSSATVPAALAVAEQTGGTSGAELLAAIALGNDLSIRLGKSIYDAWKRDWHLTPLFGVCAAAAVSARIIGLDSERLFDAVGIASCQSAGTMEMRYSVGSDVGAIYSSWASSAGVLAARLAERDIGGVDRAFEGRAGVFTVYFGGQHRRDILLEGLGQTFGGTEVSFKPWPTCGGAHGAISATIQTVTDNDIRPADIARMSVEIGYEGAWTLCEPLDERRRPKTAMDAKYSIPYTMAVAAAHRHVGLLDFNAEALNRPDILDLASRVEPVFRDGGTAESAGIHPPVRVTITTRSGRSYTSRPKPSYGRVQNPMDDDALLRKFRECARSAALPFSERAIDDIADLILDLERLPDASALFAALTPANRRGRDDHVATSPATHRPPSSH